ncbi:MAG: alpha-galactosidase, partial [Mycobacterium sp.]|nr:alpha-galactosidase [Mycobacterium sp.]
MLRTRKRRFVTLSATLGLAASAFVAVVTIGAPQRALALDNGLAPTPPMGWNGFTRFSRDVTASIVEAEAQAIVSSGMQAAGYNYVDLDGGWNLLGRGSDGELLPDPSKFPDGIKPLADYVHSLGLKFGIYTSAGNTNCSGTSEGSFGHYQQDADTFASWGVDFVKVDWCHVPVNSFPDQTAEQVAMTLGQQFRDAIANAGRPMVFDYNLNQTCPNDCNDWEWAAPIANEWRTNTDPHDNWQSVVQSFDRNVQNFAAAGPNAWNDPDSLEIGNGGLTPDEERSEFSLWSEMAAPLLAGNDPSTMSEATRSIFTNTDVIALDQDPLGKQGFPVSDSDGKWVLTKPLANGDRGVVLFNQNDTPATVSTTVTQIGLPGGLSAYTLRDLWTHTTAETAGTIEATLPPHASVMYRVAPTDNPANYPPQTAIALSASNATLGAGTQTTLTATLTNLGRMPLRQVNLSLQLPSGWTAAATSPTTFPAVPTGYTVDATWRATGAAPQTCAPSTLRTTARYVWGATSTPGSASASTNVLVSCPLTEAFDSFGITADDNVAPGNLDGVGNSFSANALASLGVVPGGTINHAGLSFTWPDVPAGQPDNVAANGQLISVSGSGDTLAVIGSEDNAGFLAAPGTVYYTDGSTSPVTLQLGRWFQSP